METDRHAPDGEDRRGEPAPDESTTAAGSPAHEGGAAHAASPQSAAEQEGAASHAYDYGEDPLAPAGDDGQRAADSGTADPGAASGDSRSPQETAEAAPGEDPATGLHPATGVRGTTAPRAVLRPVPEGFPTPPPRPARPNRRPAPKPDPAAAPRRPRTLLIAGIAAAAVLLLLVVVGGGILVVRSLSPAAEPAAPAASEEQESQDATDGDGPGGVEIGEVMVTEVSTEVGVRAVGDSGSRLEPEGEFVIVTFEVENPTTSGIPIGSGDVALETDGEMIPADKEATLAHTADSTAFSVVPPGETMTFHAVFDVPIGTQPTGLQLELAQIGESGTLPLGG